MSMVPEGDESQTTVDRDQIPMRDMQIALRILEKYGAVEHVPDPDDSEFDAWRLTPEGALLFHLAVEDD